MYFQLVLVSSLVLWECQVFGGVIDRGADENEICESQECQFTANHILKWLNPDIDPCEDFYEFACGNWKNLPENQRAKLSFGARNSLVETYIPLLIDDPSKTNGNKYFETLRDFLITCMDEDTLKSLGVTPIKQLIEKAGGWPVLGADWSEEDWDFLDAEITLGGVLIDLETSYYKSQNSSDVIYLIYVGQSSLVKRYPTPYYEYMVRGLKDKTTKTYYDTMVAIAVELGADREVAETAMMDVLEFETAFLGELQKYYPEKRTTVGELQEAFPWLDLSKLLGPYLPESFELLPEENISFKENYILVLDKFLKQYPPTTIANYMMSKAVYPLLSYVYHGVELQKEEEFGYQLFEEKDTTFDRCTNIVTDGSLGPAMAAYLGLLYSDASKAAAEMTQVIKEELSKQVEEYDWMDSVTREQAVKNVSEIQIDVGFPPKVMDFDELEKLYAGYEIDTSNLFDAVMYDKKWVKQRDFDKLHLHHTSEIDMGWKFYKIKGLRLDAGYNDKKNSIVVTGPFLYFAPLFSPENPAYVNYGHVGAVVAHELIHSVDANAAPDKQYLLAMERWGDNETEEIYNEKKQCFIDFYSSINDTKTTQRKLHGEYTQREDMADNGGLRLALRAYRKYADQLGSPERKLPRLQQYSNEQLFMISVANALCEIPNRDQRLLQLMYDPHSPMEFRVIGMMKNSPDFSEIFKCDKEDPMNPPDKCEVW